MCVLSPWGPAWGSPSPDTFLRFMLALKALVRNAPAVVYIMLPSHYMPQHTVTAATHVSNYGLKFEVFTGVSCCWHGRAAFTSSS